MSDDAPALAVDPAVQEFADALPFALVLLDHDGRIRLTNAVWDDFCVSNGGSLRAVHPPVSYLDAISVDDEPSAREIHEGVRSVLAGTSPRFEADYPCHSPTHERWFRVTVSPFDDGAVVVHADITGEYERMTRLMSDSPVAVIELGPDDQALWVNQQWADLCARARTAVTGTGWLEPIAEADRPDLLATIADVRRRHQIAHRDIEVVEPSGAARTFHVAVSTPTAPLPPGARTVAISGVDVTVERGLLRDRTLAAERRRIRSDLHDTVIQRLYAAAVVADDLRRGRARLTPDPLGYIIAGLTTSMAELRAITGTRAAAPTPLTGSTLQTVLDLAAPALGFMPELRVLGDITAAPAGVAQDVLAVVTEALSNVARHARASTCVVTLTVTMSNLTVQIDDDGVGLDPGTERRSGMAHLAERAERSGGIARWDSSPETGTSLTWTVPLPLVRDEPE